jgi:3-phosphoshikimate 1-carboxyvinyltransferase
VPVEYEVPVPSAQVKSAVMLAALNTPGETTVIEKQHTRDHTERMMRHFGFEVRIEDQSRGVRRITVPGHREVSARPIVVPGDPSSAAFAAAAAAIVPGSEVVLRGVGLNPLRFGFYQTLRDMGVAIEIDNKREESGEPVGDITIRNGSLRAVDVPADRAPSMIDEYPVLAVVAGCAAGTTRMRGLAELRVKESDRLAAIAAGLTVCGIRNAIEDDMLVVEGCGGPVPGGGNIETRLDHRMAMSFLVMGMAAENPVSIDDGGAIATSYPNFVADMNRLGAAIAPADG